MLDRGRSADDAGEWVAGRSLAGRDVHVHLLQRRTYRRDELGVVIPLHQVLERAVAHGLHSIGNGAESSHHHHLAGGLKGLEGTRELHAMGVGQPHIAQHHREGTVLHELQAGRAGLRRGHVVTFSFEHAAQHVAQLGFVVDDEQAGSGGHGAK